MCGLSAGNLSNYITRDKVVLSGEFIDDSLPINADFLKKRREKLQDAPPVPETTPIETPPQPVVTTPPVIHTPQKKPPKGPNIAKPAKDQGGDTLERQLKRQELAKKEAETRLLELKEEKIRGEVIHLDLVVQLFNSYTQAIVAGQKDILESFLVNISKEARLSGEQTAHYRGRIIRLLNESADKSIAVARKGIKAMAEEFALKKDVGEHD